MAIVQSRVRVVKVCVNTKTRYLTGRNCDANVSSVRTLTSCRASGRTSGQLGVEHKRKFRRLTMAANVCCRCNDDNSILSHCKANYNKQSDADKKRVLLAMAVGLDGCCLENKDFFVPFNKRDWKPSKKQVLTEAKRRFASMKMDRSLCLKPDTAWSRKQVVQWLGKNPIRCKGCVKFLQTQVAMDIYGRTPEPLEITREQPEKQQQQQQQQRQEQEEQQQQVHKQQSPQQHSETAPTKGTPQEKSVLDQKASLDGQHIGNTQENSLMEVSPSEGGPLKKNSRPAISKIERPPILTEQAVAPDAPTAMGSLPATCKEDTREPLVSCRCPNDDTPTMESSEAGTSVSQQSQQAGDPLASNVSLQKELEPMEGEDEDKTQKGFPVSSMEDASFTATASEATRQSSEGPLSAYDDEQDVDPELYQHVADILLQQQDAASNATETSAPVSPPQHEQQHQQFQEDQDLFDDRMSLDSRHSSRRKNRDNVETDSFTLISGLDRNSTASWEDDTLDSTQRSLMNMSLASMGSQNMSMVTSHRTKGSSTSGGLRPLMEDRILDTDEVTKNTTTTPIMEFSVPGSIFQTDDEDGDARSISAISESIYSQMSDDFWGDSATKKVTNRKMRLDKNLTGVYTGACRRVVRTGLQLPRIEPHGEGRMRYSDGRVYQGNWCEGEWHERGKLEFGAGDFYEGEFTNGVRQGYGIRCWPDGSKYEGDWEADMRHGKGTQEFAGEEQGASYDGGWRDDTMSGEGKYNFSDGTVYEGNFLDGKFDGQGVRFWANGSQYIGLWRAGFRHGRGTFLMNEFCGEGEWANDEIVEGDGRKDFDDGSYYEGHFRQGQFDGQGTKCWADGFRYVGQWQEGKRHGYGTLVFENGYMMEGQWSNDNFYSGRGRKRLTDGSTYQGDFKNGNFDGRGVLCGIDGSKYDGEWKSGQRHGSGKHTTKDGEVKDGRWTDDTFVVGTVKLVMADGSTEYEGGWKNGKKEGHGTEKSPLGLYVGEWSNDLPHGNGRCTYGGDDNDCYEGEFVKGEFSGEGTRHWPDGSYFIGNWMTSKRHGKGLYKYRNGDEYDGDWVYDSRDGTGRYTFADGGCYDGSIVNDTPQGHGERRWPDGSTYVGEWRTGNRHGMGRYVAAGGKEEYEGEWLNDKRHGNGFSRYTDGFYEGGFANDLMEGFGKRFWSDGTEYIGHWMGDHRHGRGTYESAHARIDADWENDELVCIYEQIDCHPPQQQQQEEEALPLP